MMKRTVILITFLFGVLSLTAQEVATTSDTLRKDALNVFMESSDYIRKEIPFVN